MIFYPSVLESGEVLVFDSNPHPCRAHEVLMPNHKVRHVLLDILEMLDKGATRKFQRVSLLGTLSLIIIHLPNEYQKMITMIMPYAKPYNSLLMRQEQGIKIQDIRLTILPQIDFPSLPLTGGIGDLPGSHEFGQRFWSARDK